MDAMWLRGVGLGMNSWMAAVAIAALVLAGCGRDAAVKEGAQASTAGGAPRTPAGFGFALPGSRKAACEGPAGTPSASSEQASKVVEACLAVMAANADEDGESGWNRAQETAAAGGDASAQFLAGLTRIAHPDGRLRKVDGMRAVEARQLFDGAARGGYGQEVFELGKRWQPDRRRIENDEQRNALHVTDDLFLVAAHNENPDALVEFARKKIEDGLRYERMPGDWGPASRTEFGEARVALSKVETSGNEKQKRLASQLLAQLR
jgi:hypothetical protein